MKVTTVIIALMLGGQYYLSMDVYVKQVSKHVVNSSDTMTHCLAIWEFGGIRLQIFDFFECLSGFINVLIVVTQDYPNNKL